MVKNPSLSVLSVVSYISCIFVVGGLYSFIALQMLIFMASGLQIPMNEAISASIRVIRGFIFFREFSWLAVCIRLSHCKC